MPGPGGQLSFRQLTCLELPKWGVSAIASHCDRHPQGREQPGRCAIARSRPSQMFSPPPAAWADVGPARQPSPARPLPSAAATPDQLAQAYKHVRSVVQSEGRTPDLYDLLSHSVRETQYSFSPQGVSGPLGEAGGGGSWRHFVHAVLPWLGMQFMHAQQCT